MVCIEVRMIVEGASLEGRIRGLSRDAEEAEGSIKAGSFKREIWAGNIHWRSISM